MNITEKKRALVVGMTEAGLARLDRVMKQEKARSRTEALKNVIGEEAILNYVRANPSAFKEALGG